MRILESVKLHFRSRQRINTENSSSTFEVIVVAGSEEAGVVHERSPEHIVDLQASTTTELTGNHCDGTHVVVNNIFACNRKNQTVSFGFVGERFFFQFAVFQLASRTNFFILLFANQPITGDGFEIGHRLNCCNLPPGLLDHHEGIEHHLIGDV